ncbi:hypothetical protein TPB0596_44560 [Tsukamurella pulmonis]|nr:hypothetical protein TPB0596_44560 [Tsukamurella pulmonis]
MDTVAAPTTIPGPFGSSITYITNPREPGMIVSGGSVTTVYPFSLGIRGTVYGPGGIRQSPDGTISVYAPGGSSTWRGPQGVYASTTGSGPYVSSGPNGFEVYLGVRGYSRGIPGLLTSTGNTYFGQGRLTSTGFTASGPNGSHSFWSPLGTLTNSFSAGNLSVGAGGLFAGGGHFNLNGSSPSLGGGTVNMMLGAISITPTGLMLQSPMLTFGGGGPLGSLSGAFSPIVLTLDANGLNIGGGGWSLGGGSIFGISGGGGGHFGNLHLGLDGLSIQGPVASGSLGGPLGTINTLLQGGFFNLGASGLSAGGGMGLVNVGTPLGGHNTVVNSGFVAVTPAGSTIVSPSGSSTTSTPAGAATVDVRPVIGSVDESDASINGGSVTGNVTNSSGSTTVTVAGGSASTNGGEDGGPTSTPPSVTVEHTTTEDGDEADAAKSGGEQADGAQESDDTARTASGDAADEPADAAESGSESGTD